ncbi:MAG: 23S rRNA (uracil-5-)-methyltransferase RumA, partial [Candidatus Niameybacter stercoravium]|nr:23S rRNA (uracil-5-)-methyltransferase RumA [Candidatus Niameybacter stercoravium]
DPPRKGCDTKLLETLKAMAPQKIVYVSCDPATLARDLAYLTNEAGYHVEKVQPVDMFPHTTHVECCVSLKKIK